MKQYQIFFDVKEKIQVQFTKLKEEFDKLFKTLSKF